jgi:ribosomal protein L16 Arg81 hydroxylase
VKANKPYLKPIVCFANIVSEGNLSMHGTQLGRVFAPAETDTPAPRQRFLDRLSLRTLLEPFSKEEFCASYWEKKPLVISRGDRSFYDDLFTLQDFDESITRGPSYVKTAEATAKKQQRHHGTGVQTLERVLADVRDGATLILDAVQQRDPKLGLLCRTLAQETGHGFQTNLYLTPPNGKGFLPHWDNHDVFVLQVLGLKHWTLETERRTFPDKAQTIADEDRDLRGELTSFTLEQGDVVYIPRGFVHAAECGSECSLHITLGVGPTTWDEFLYAVIKAAAQQDETLRYALPFGYLNADAAVMVERASRALRAATDPAFLAAVADQFRDEMVKNFALDISGQVSAFYQPAPLTLGDKVGARPGTLYTMRRRAETISVNVGGRTITFPAFLGETLDFALNHAAFAIRDLPGDLEEGEKIVVVERLMQEGLVIRK